MHAHLDPPSLPFVELRMVFNLPLYRTLNIIESSLKELGRDWSSGFCPSNYLHPKWVRLRTGNIPQNKNMVGVYFCLKESQKEHQARHTHTRKTKTHKRTKTPPKRKKARKKERKKEAVNTQTHPPPPFSPQRKTHTNKQKTKCSGDIPNSMRCSF